MKTGIGTTQGCVQPLLQTTTDENYVSQIHSEKQQHIQTSHIMPHLTQPKDPEFPHRDLMNMGLPGEMREGKC